MVPEKLNWILASASPRRSRLLAEIGLVFRVDPSYITEPAPVPGEPPAKYVIRAARHKARDTADRHRTGLVIGADTIVVAGGRVMGKPESEADARRMIMDLSGRWHEVVTGMCIRDCRTRRSSSAFERSRVHFRRVSRDEIDWYIRMGEYRDKAGAYAIQGYASLFIDSLEGCYFNVVGFPISRFERLCRAFGVSLRDYLRQPRPLKEDPE